MKLADPTEACGGLRGSVGLLLIQAVPPWYSMNSGTAQKPRWVRVKEANVWKCLTMAMWHSLDIHLSEVHTWPVSSETCSVVCKYCP